MAGVVLRVSKSDVEAALNVLNFAIYHKELAEMEEREQEREREQASKNRAEQRSARNDRDDQVAADVGGWTAITQLAHHGMLFVPIGYTFGAGMFKMDSIRGGSPYGAGVFAGDGSREPTESELALAEHQGKYMAAIVKKLAQA